MIARRIPAVLLIVLVLGFCAAADQSDRVAMILVNGPQTSWSDQDIVGKMERLIGTRQNFALMPLHESEVLTQELDGRFDQDRLMNWGQRANCRFVIWCDVTREELRLEKNFSIPFLISQKRVAARLEIDYRILDCLKTDRMHSDRIVKRKYGPSAMQVIDDMPADPDLYCSYFERREMFEKLETDAAREVFSALERMAKRK